MKFKFGKNIYDVTIVRYDGDIVGSIEYSKVRETHVFIRWNHLPNLTANQLTQLANKIKFCNKNLKTIQK
jgi:hypothetical protein